MDKKVLVKKIIFAFLLFIFCLSLIALRFVLTAKSEFSKGIEFMQNGNTAPAIDHFDLSIRSYFPFSPYIKMSTDKIAQIAEKYESQEMYQDSFNTWQTLMSSLSAIKHPFFTPSVPFAKISENMNRLRDKIKEKQTE